MIISFKIVPAVKIDLIIQYNALTNYLIIKMSELQRAINLSTLNMCVHMHCMGSPSEIQVTYDLLNKSSTCVNVLINNGYLIKNIANIVGEYVFMFRQIYSE